MLEIHTFLEEKSVLWYLQKRNLVKQYKSAKLKLISWFRGKLDLKERQPKGSWVFSFRINQQYCALGYFRSEGVFVVVEIDDHQ